MSLSYFVHVSIFCSFRPHPAAYLNPIKTALSGGGDLKIACATILLFIDLREAAKTGYFFSGPTNKRGGGVILQMAIP